MLLSGFTTTVTKIGRNCIGRVDVEQLVLRMLQCILHKSILVQRTI